MQFIDKIFRLTQNNTNVKTEITAGLTTFFTMTYMFIISPKFLSAMGMNFQSSITITCLVIFISCTLMAFISNKPYALAPFVGETAFCAYTLSEQMGYNFKTILAAFFCIGIIMLLLTLFKIRTYVIKQLPDAVKISFCLGLGLYFIYIALKDIGFLSILNVYSNGLDFNVNILHSSLGLFCLILLIALIKRNMKSAIIVSIALTTLIGVIVGDVDIPSKIISVPSSINSSLLQFDFSGLFTKNFIPVFIILFFIANIDTAGSLIALLYKTEKNEISDTDLKRPMIADSLSTVIASIFGTTTTGSFIDSVTGINAGGKTGLTPFTAGILFLIGLLFSPIIIIIPAYAYSPVLLFVGILLTSNISKTDFTDISEYGVVILTVSFMIFTNNIGFGIITGLFTYPIIKLICCKAQKTNIIQWLMFVMAIIFFIIYPY